MQQLDTPRGPVPFIPRDLKKWPRNSQPPAIDEAKLRGVTVHWPGGVEAKRYANADTFEKLLAIDTARVGDSIRGHNARPGITDVGYNYLIGRSGVLFEGRGWTRNGANGALLKEIRDQYPPGTAGSNPWWVSVQVIAGTDLPDLTAAQWETLKRFYTWVVARAGIAHPQVNGHRDVRATACPGDVVHGRLPDVAAAWPVVASKPPVPPTPDPEEDDMAATVIRVNDGDRAQFAVVGGMARWITSPDERQTLDFLGQTKPGSLLPVNRADLKAFVLVGPAPDYGSLPGPYTTAADFGSVA